MGGIRRLGQSLLTAICLSFAQPPQHAAGYGVDKSGDASPHNYMLRRAISDLHTRYPNYEWPLLVYWLDLNFGSWYADNSELKCGWDYIIGTETHSCDQLHHYGEIGDVKSVSGITVGNTGDFAAPDYAAALYKVALDFWPGAPIPSFAALPLKHGGWSELLVGPTFDFGFTNLGGWPLCRAIVARLLYDQYYESLGARPKRG
jgi:hypothetical protein